jgi:hypothetical protein
VADCFRCQRAKIVGIKTIPYQLAQRIRAECPRNFEEAADDFERCVEDGAATARRAQENTVRAGQNLVREKVGEICATDLSSRFIATELLAHSLRMLFPAHDIEVTRVLAAKHWEEVFQGLPQQLQPA